MKIFLIIILSACIFAMTDAKTITIDSPYLLGDEIILFEGQAGEITGICIDKDTLFYQVRNKQTQRLIYFTLEEIQKIQPSIQVNG